MDAVGGENTEWGAVLDPVTWQLVVRLDSVEVEDAARQCQVGSLARLPACSAALLLCCSAALLFFPRFACQALQAVGTEYKTRPRRFAPAKDWDCLVCPQA